MKLTNLQKIIIALLVAPLVYAASYYLYTPLVKSSLESIMSEAKIDEEIFASKVATLNQVHSMYEKSNIIGFNNCIKLNPEAVCSKRMKQITNHFDNEYNTKLLKLLAEKSGVALNENGKTGKLTAVGKLSTNEGRLPYITGKDLYISKETKEAINTAFQGTHKNKDEVETIGSKFAELGLKAQTSHSTESIDIDKASSLFKNKNSNEKLLLTDLLDVAERAEANGGYTLKNKEEVASAITNYGKSQMIALKSYKSIMERLDLEEAQKGASGIEMSPALMDTLTDSGRKLFNAATSVEHNQKYQDYMNAYNSAAIKANEIYKNNETYKNN